MTPSGRGKYESFAQLAECEVQGTDYRVRCVQRPESGAVIVAPHGGMIEAGTSEIAELIAGAEHSLFCFEGLHAHRSRELHITSHRFDHPECVTLTARHEVVVSVHGCRGEARVFVGGLDADLVQRLTHELTAAGFEASADQHAYPGRHPLNICNRGRRRKGAQLEITWDLRAPAHRAALAAAARRALFGEELRPPAGPPKN